jgi:hypothetical protein
MAKFLDTTGVSYHLQQLINNANERLILISPFLKINERIKQSLEKRYPLLMKTSAYLKCHQIGTVFVSDAKRKSATAYLIHIVMRVSLAGKNSKTKTIRKNIVIFAARKIVRA